MCTSLSALQTINYMHIIIMCGQIHIITITIHYHLQSYFISRWCLFLQPASLEHLCFLYTIYNIDIEIQSSWLVVCNFAHTYQSAIQINMPEGILGILSNSFHLRSVQHVTDTSYACRIIVSSFHMNLI